MSVLTEKLDKLYRTGELEKLITEDMYAAKEICSLIDVPDSQTNNVNSYLRKHDLHLPYPRINDYNSRIIEKYQNEASRWWEIPKLKSAIEFKLKNNLVINYADKEKKIGRYVISFKYHPRASSAHQVKAHIILWELYNEKPFPDNCVLVPKDKNFLNLTIENFNLYDNDEYRSIVATDKRNHFYTTGSASGCCYKGGWKSISKKLMDEICKCEICGKEERLRLNVHHIINYNLFDKPKDAHFKENLLCVCDSCHQYIHTGKINLSGTLSEKRKLKLFEVLEKLKAKKYDNIEKENLAIKLIDFAIKSISRQAETEGSTTISKESTSQANGDGSGKPLTDIAEGDDIV